MIDDVAQKKIMEAYEKILIAESTAKISDVADLFVRALIGDRKSAGNQIAKLSNSNIEGIEDLLDMYVGKGKNMKDAESFNKLWSDLYNALYNAIFRTVRGR